MSYLIASDRGDELHAAYEMAAIKHPDCICEELEDPEADGWWVEDARCPVHDLPYRKER